MLAGTDIVPTSYPASVISVTLGQPSFLAYMGLLDAQGEVVGSFLNTVGATSGIFQGGAAVNTILTAIVLDRVCFPIEWRCQAQTADTILLSSLAEG